jgi:hypothetical protein
MKIFSPIPNCIWTNTKISCSFVEIAPISIFCEIVNEKLCQYCFLPNNLFFNVESTMCLSSSSSTVSGLKELSSSDGSCRYIVRPGGENWGYERKDFFNHNFFSFRSSSQPSMDDLSLLSFVSESSQYLEKLVADFGVACACGNVLDFGVGFLTDNISLLFFSVE